MNKKDLIETKLDQDFIVPQLYYDWHGDRSSSPYWLILISNLIILILIVIKSFLP